MSDRDPIELEGGRPSRFLPSYIWREQPGLNPQKKRAWFLKHLYLTPLSFYQVVFDFGIRSASWFVVLTIINLFFQDFIDQHLLGIYVLITVTLTVYLLYNRTIVVNAPELAEETIFNGFLNIVTILLPIYWVYVLP